MTDPNLETYRRANGEFGTQPKHEATGGLPRAADGDHAFATDAERAEAYSGYAYDALLYDTAISDQDFLDIARKAVRLTHTARGLSSIGPDPDDETEDVVAGAYHNDDLLEEAVSRTLGPIRETQRHQFGDLLMGNLYDVGLEYREKEGSVATTQLEETA